MASFVRYGHYKKVIRQGHKKIIREGHNEGLCKGMLLKRTGFTIRQYVAREAYIVFVYDRLVESEVTGMLWESGGKVVCAQSRRTG